MKYHIHIMQVSEFQKALAFIQIQYHTICQSIHRMPFYILQSWALNQLQCERKDLGEQLQN